MLSIFSIMLLSSDTYYFKKKAEMSTMFESRGTKIWKSCISDPSAKYMSSSI